VISRRAFLFEAVALHQRGLRDLGDFALALRVEDVVVRKQLLRGLV